MGAGAVSILGFVLTVLINKKLKDRLVLFLGLAILTLAGVICLQVRGL